jgi:hypothetical protein
VSDLQREVADVNGSGSVNATDALQIQQFFLDTRSSFDAGVFASTTASAEAPAEGVDLQVAAYGDVNLSGGVASGASAASTLAVTTTDAPSSTAKSVTTQRGPEGRFDVPVSLGQSADLGAYSLTIEYPEGKASFEGISAQENVQARAENGTIRVSWFDDSGNRPLTLDGGDVLFTLQFTAKDGVDNDASFTLGDVTGEFAAPDATVMSGVGVQVPAVKFGPVVPESFAFNGNYPNPTNGQTQIAFDLPSDAKVSVEIYDMLGRQVMSVPQTSMTAGVDKTLSVDGSRLSSGLYLYRLSVETASETIRETGRMTVVK